MKLQRQRMYLAQVAPQSATILVGVVGLLWFKGQEMRLESHGCHTWKEKKETHYWFMHFAIPYCTSRGSFWSNIEWERRVEIGLESWTELLMPFLLFLFSPTKGKWNKNRLWVRFFFFPLTFPSLLRLHNHTSYLIRYKKRGIKNWANPKIAEIETLVKRASLLRKTTFPRKSDKEERGDEPNLQMEVFPPLTIPWGNPFCTCLSFSFSFSLFHSLSLSILSLSLPLSLSKAVSLSFSPFLFLSLSLSFSLSLSNAIFLLLSLSLSLLISLSFSLHHYFSLSVASSQGITFLDIS